MSESDAVNRRAWNERVRRRDGYIDTATPGDFARPLATADPYGWLGGDVRGKKLLCLAAGGGRHGPLLAAAGAMVTVVDLSPAMLELDRQVARDRGLPLRLIETSMDDLSQLAAGEFDAVIQPVSTCYVPKIGPVYAQVARVTAPGGVYVSQHKQPVNLQSDTTPTPRGYPLTEAYYRAGPLPAAGNDSVHREAGTVEFLHRWEELLGELCRSGFVIEAVAEPRHGDPRARPGSFAHRSLFVPPYLALKARRTETAPEPVASRTLWWP